MYFYTFENNELINEMFINETDETEVEEIKNEIKDKFGKVEIVIQEDRLEPLDVG